MICTTCGPQAGLGLTSQGLLSKVDQGRTAGVGVRHQQAEPAYSLKPALQAKVRPRSGHSRDEAVRHQSRMSGRVCHWPPSIRTHLMPPFRAAPSYPQEGAREAGLAQGPQGPRRWWGGEGLGQTLENKKAWPRLGPSRRARDPRQQGKGKRRRGGGGGAAGLCLL